MAEAASAAGAPRVAPLDRRRARTPGRADPCRGCAAAGTRPGTTHRNRAARRNVPGRSSVAECEAIHRQAARQAAAAADHIRRCAHGDPARAADAAWAAESRPGLHPLGLAAATGMAVLTDALLTRGVGVKYVRDDLVVTG